MGAIVLEATKREGSRRHRDAWRKMDTVDLRAYAYAGMYKSPGKAVASLWDAKSGRTNFRAAMPLKVLYVYWSLLRFDDRETPAEPLQPRAQRDGGRAAGPVQRGYTINEYREVMY
ncbi:hypothetical protein DPEC_G00000330 [Dallia pectoralis]|uniref:Uncharacterized protein n=1 Tax=Dallia pectoralis TaxID=75939 RepID=A0ACC2HIJ2_DALPE|nr:hypothetical protein DPEC_G00000330 [Dallia pectoralis]